MLENKEMIKINLLGQFTFEYKDKNVFFEQLAPKQLSSLMTMIAINAPQSVSKEEIIETLWTKEELSSSALKFSIHRLRNLLDQEFQLYDLIQNSSGGYFFNKKYDVEIDLCILRDAYSNYITNKTISFETLKTAVQLYQGKVALKMDSPWLIHAQSRFHKMYLTLVELYFNECMEREDYHDCLNIAKLGLKIDPTNETAAYYQFAALIELKNYDEAYALYQSLSTYFSQELGQTLSERFKAYHALLIKQLEHNHLDYNKMKELLNDKTFENGAFVCDFDLFRHLYQLECRKLIRDENKSFLIFFELQGKDDSALKRSYSSRLIQLLISSIRKGDIISRINNSQIALLVRCKTLESGQVMIERILTLFYEKFQNELTIKYKIEEILPEVE